MKIRENLELVTTDDFYYDLFEGGYIDPLEILSEGGEDVIEAVRTITVFKDFLEKEEKLELM